MTDQIIDTQTANMVLHSSFEIYRQETKNHHENNTSQVEFRLRAATIVKIIFDGMDE